MPNIQWTDTDRKILLDGDLRSQVEREHFAQLHKWGVRTHTPAEWFLILGEELGELGKAICDAQFDGEVTDEIRVEAIQLATVALKIAYMASR